MKNELIEDLKTNIISWYDFATDSEILYLGGKDDIIYKCLKEKCKNVEIQPKQNKYDYIVMISHSINVNKVIENEKFLKEDGKILLAFNNEYGISKFLSYDSENRVSPLEKANFQNPSRDYIEKKLNKIGYKNINTYVVFPNIYMTDLIINKKMKNIDKKIDKFFPNYGNEDYAVITDEISVLRNLCRYSKKLFINLADAFFMEIAKNETLCDTKYISFNNYRKKEYQLTTIIKEDRVIKKATNKEGISNFKNICNNIELLNEYTEFEIMDKCTDKYIYSNYIKDSQTLDIELADNAKNSEFVIKVLNEIKDILLKHSLPYNNSEVKKYNEIIENEEEKEKLKKLNYLKYGFYDMVPKNCFYIEGKYYFFDQEWMEKWIPVEFIIYRSVINSYDLVGKINVDELLEKLGILEYKEIFVKMDNELREKILDKPVFDALNYKNSKMYEILYKKVELEIYNKNYIEDNKNKQEYIEKLEKEIKQYRKE